RQPLDGSKPGTIGLDWRSPGAEENARGHVVGIDGERFLVTNGSRGLMRILWTAGDYSKEQEATLVEGARIVAAPVVLRREGGAYDVAVADAEGRVTLLEGATLKPRRSWTTGGTI